MSWIPLPDGGRSPDRAAVPGQQPTQPRSHRLVPSAQVMHGAVVVQRAALQVLDTSLAREQDAVASAQQRVLVRRQLMRPVAATDALLVKMDE